MIVNQNESMTIQLVTVAQCHNINRYNI